MINVEWELDPVTHKRTGRWRRTQFRPTPRSLEVPPSQRVSMPWRGP